jgi:uncharacterized protein (TIGR03435 family)
MARAPAAKTAASAKVAPRRKYDFDLKSYQTYTSQRKDDETNPWPTLAQAIQEQLGLKIVPTHGPVPMLVIEHVQGPSEN